MATTTTNYNLTKPTMAEIADIRTLNNNMDKVDEVMHSTQVSLAPAYDLLETYNTGDIVMYELLMYKCKEDNVTGAWNPAKWERTTAGENGSGGGGSSVVPNPQGSPTDTLETIEIDGTVYDIAGSGGGGGSAYEETTLWSGSDSASMTLSESFENYDAVMIIARTTYNNTEYSMSAIWSVDYMKAHINDGMRFELTGDSWYIYFSIADATTFVRQDHYYFYISNIIGLKLGGGASANKEVINIWNYVDDNSGNIYWEGNAITLNDDINDYDEIVVEIISAVGDLSDSWKSSFQWRLTPEILANAIEPYTFTICSYSQRSAKFEFTSTTLQKLMGNNQENGVINVYGIKYGVSAGNSGGYSETSLYTYTGSTRQTTLSLSDDYTNYDAIEFTFGWNIGGDDFETVDVISSSKIVSNVFVNVGDEGRYNYISRGGADDEIILATATGSWDGSSIIREVRGINY